MNFLGYVKKTLYWFMFCIFVQYIHLEYALFLCIYCWDICEFHQKLTGNKAHVLVSILALKSLLKLCINIRLKDNWIQRKYFSLILVGRGLTTGTYLYIKWHVYCYLFFATWCTLYKRSEKFRVKWKFSSSYSEPGQAKWCSVYLWDHSAHVFVCSVTNYTEFGWGQLLPCNRSRRFK